MHPSSVFGLPIVTKGLKASGSGARWWVSGGSCLPLDPVVIFFLRKSWLVS